MLYAIVAVIVLILDQGLKYWTTVNIALDGTTRELLPGVVHLTNIHNSGAAFGLLDSVSFARWLFVILTVIFVIVVIVLVAAKTIKGGFGRWMAVLVVAGAIGNCIDRVLHGYVVDMFELEFMTFPVFNVADIFITVCGILFCVYIICSGSGKEEVDEEAEKAKAARLAAAKRSKGNAANIDEISKISAGGKTPAKSEKPEKAAEKPAEKPKAEPKKPAAAARHMTVEQQREEYARRQRQTYEHGAKTRPKSDDFFAEWEKKQEPESVPVFTPPAAKEESRPRPEPEAKPVPEEKERTRVTVDDEEMEFSLEDILDEFK